MNCEQARASLSAHLDNELPPSEASQVAAHLSACPACASELEGLKRASHLVRDLPLKPLPLGFLSRLGARRAAAGPALPASAWLAPKPLAFAAAALVAGLVVAGPWRSARLARAPGGPLEAAAPPAPAELPALKTAVEPPAPAADSPAPAAAPAEAPAAPAAQAGAPQIQGADELRRVFAARKKAQEFTAQQYGLLEQRGNAAATLDMPAGGGGAAGGGAAGAPVGSPEPYSNEQLHEMLDKEAKAEGIRGSAKDLESEEEKPDTSFLGRHLGMPGSREQSNQAIRQLQAMRRAVEANAGRPAQVPIAGTVAPVLGASGEYGGGAGGQAIEGPAQALSEGFWSGDYAAGNQGTRTVESEADWSALWRTLSTTPAPVVDFNKSMVVAVFLGPRPTGGYAVEFDATKRLARSLVVRWRERAPEPGVTPPEGATSPYALKVLPKSDVPVRFEKVR